MTKLKWWERGIIYQIYPRSFQDTNADGIGDLPGITERLSYLATLGVDAIWISPIYPSPMADFGYDVADYCNISEIFGSLSDFDRLLAEAHARDLKVILDYVPNHTSSQHPWFLESRSSRNNSQREWYIWKDATRDGSVPNNWLSEFGGSGWEWDETTRQYYYHSFLKEQPDLNWRNPAVQQAMYNVLRFWLARGVDGFRVDVIWMLIKDNQFRDNPVNPGFVPGQPSHNKVLPIYTTNRPEVHAIIADMRRVLDEYQDRVLIGEVYLPIQQLVTYYGFRLDGANLPLNFQLLESPWNAEHIARIIRDYEAALPEGAWPNWVLGNHDKARIASRIGEAQARVAAMLLLTLRGTPTIYYGEELGMQNVPIPANQVRDPAEKNEPGIGMGRDPERTPMPWDGSPSRGFTSGTPWLPLGNAHSRVNVAAMSKSKTSMLNLYQRLVELRRDNRPLTAGQIDSVRACGNVLIYERKLGSEKFTIMLNLGDEQALVSLPKGQVVLSTYLDDLYRDVTASTTLRPNEGILLRG